MPRQLHDGLDAHGMVGQSGDEAPAATVAGRPGYARLTIDAVDQLAQGVGGESPALAVALLADQHGISGGGGWIGLEIGGYLFA